MNANKPSLPVAFYQPSLVGTLSFILFSYFMLCGGWVSIYYLVSSDTPVWIKILLLIPLYVMVGQGLHLLGWIGHEGFHFNLAKNRHVSVILSIILTQPLTLFSTVGENTIHWSHHKYTNKPGDPQVELFPKYQTLWSRLLLARMELEHIYIRNVILLAFDRLDVTMALPTRTMVQYARLDLLLSAAVFAFYLYVLIQYPFWGLLLIVIPHLVAFLISSVRPFVEHAGTEEGEFSNARSAISPLFTALYFCNNYHLEHHLYPRVPCWRLPKVQKYLVQQGAYADQKPHITRGVFSALRCATSAYIYPKPSMRAAKTAG